jgi:hypothetical protein
MTTPASGQISLGNLKSELSLIGGPSADISLANMAAYIMADGFWDTYGYTYTIGYGAGPVNLSYFYDLQTNASFDFYVQSSVTDYSNFLAYMNNQSQAGGQSGPNAKTPTWRNPTSGIISPGTNNGVNIVHMYSLDVTVTCDHNAPPRPPFNDLFVEYDNGSGYTGFPGSPFQGPSIIATTGALYNSPNSTGTPTFYVQCYM